MLSRANMRRLPGKGIGILTAICFLLLIGIMSRAFEGSNEYVSWINPANYQQVSLYEPHISLKSYLKVLPSHLPQNLTECQKLVKHYRHEEVTDLMFKTISTQCQTRMPDGLFVPTFLNEMLGDFEEKCPKSFKLLTTPRPLIALASFPGSGNTWNRELIETTTGIQTGSVYKDWNFAGSMSCPTRGKVFIIKTHLTNLGYAHPDCRSLNVKSIPFSKVVLILRNPYDALLAEFNRQVSDKRKTEDNPGVGLAKQMDFNAKGWDSFVERHSTYWMNMADFWIKKAGIPVHVLVYEEVRKNPPLEMYILSKFLNTTITFNSLFCLSSGSVGNFHRQKPEWMSPEKLFRKEHKIVVNERIKSLQKGIGNVENLSDILTSYILPEN